MIDKRKLSYYVNLHQISGSGGLSRSVNLIVDDKNLVFCQDIHEESMYSGHEIVIPRDLWDSVAYESNGDKILFRTVEGKTFTFSIAPKDPERPENREAAERIDIFMSSTTLREKIRDDSPMEFRKLQQSLNDCVPVNEKYWRDLGLFAASADRNRVNEENDFNKQAYARDLFQDGIIHLMNNREDLTDERFLRSIRAYDSVLHTPFEFHDFLRKFFIEIFRMRVERREYLRNAQTIIKSQVEKQILLNACHDIFQVFRLRNYIQFSDEFLRVVQSFPSAAPDKYSDKYTYESIADQMISLAKLEFLLGEYSEVLKATSIAQELYNLAYRSITREVGDLYTGFPASRGGTEGVEGDPDQFLQEKKLLEGNIPLFEFQKILLDDMCMLSKKPSLFPEIISNLDKLVSRVINPPDKSGSSLGFIEEIEWAFIIRKFYRCFFGFFWKETPAQVLRLLLK